MAGDLGEGIGDDPEIEAEEGLPIKPTGRGEPGPVGEGGLRVPSTRSPPPIPPISPMMLPPLVSAISFRMLSVRFHCGFCPPTPNKSSPLLELRNEEEVEDAKEETPEVGRVEEEEDNAGGRAGGRGGGGTYKDPLLLLLKGEPPAVMLRRSAKAFSRSAPAFVSFGLPIPPAAAPAAVQACMTA